MTKNYEFVIGEESSSSSKNASIGTLDKVDCASGLRPRRTRFDRFHNCISNFNDIFPY